MKKRMITLLMTGCMAVSLFGCADTAPSTVPNDEETTAETESTETNEQDTAAETEDRNTDSSVDGLKMVSYFPAPHSYYDEVQDGVKAFSQDTGVNVDIQLGNDWEQATETEKVEALVAQGANALSIYPADASGANGLYDEITAQGVDVINFGADVNHPTNASFAVATDVKQAAYEACAALIEMMGEKGSIINVLEVLEDSNTAKRKEGVEQAVAEYPDVEIIQEVAGIGSVEEAVSKIENSLSANAGQVNGIICTGANPSVGLVSVLSDYYEKQPDAEHIYNIVMDTDPTVTGAIGDDVLDATIAQNPYGHGYISCMLLKYLYEGYEPVSEDAYFVDAGFCVVNKDNLETYKDDLSKRTQEILDSLTTDYLTK